MKKIHRFSAWFGALPKERQMWLLALFCGSFIAMLLLTSPDLGDMMPKGKLYVPKHIGTPSVAVLPDSIKKEMNISIHQQK